MQKQKSAFLFTFPGVVSCLLFLIMLFPFQSTAQAPIGSGTYSLKIYHVNYGFYPIVQAYLRTWDSEREPLENLNIANIGLQVKGRNYDPHISAQQHQYSIETIERRAEGFRTVIVLDASGSMQGEPFADALNALNGFVEAKRPVDQVAVIAVRDQPQGYEVVSQFEANATLLYQRIRDIKCDGMQTRLNDSVGAALEMCGTAFSGDMASLEYAVLSTVVVLSDGNDEGSAISRDELINRIGMMEIPIPIHCIAFTKTDSRQSLKNMEAISRASFGRYWDTEDTKQISRVMQEIHRINRADYVVTFRSYVPVDGGLHPFRIGVEYPSGSGHLLYSSASLEAIDSPAVFNTALRDRYAQLMAAYPELPGTPFAGAGLAPAPTGATLSQEAMETMPDGNLSDATAQVTTEQAIEQVDAAEREGSDSDDDQGVLAWLKENIPLIGAGAGILALLGFIVLWVKSTGKSASAPASRSTTPSSSHDSSAWKSPTHGAVDSDTKTRPITSVDPQDRTR